MNHVVAGEDNHERALAKLLNIDLNDEAQRTFIYAMEFMKYGNMNVIVNRPSACPAFKKLPNSPCACQPSAHRRLKFSGVIINTNFSFLQGMLRKISELGARLRSKELWRVFYCLFRACVGLAYGTSPSWKHIRVKIS